ncbi:MAG: TonB-dependent receptor [Caulobacter sp.]|nr:TonB-dependent receptor [Caulobacter sp.]
MTKKLAFLATTALAGTLLLATNAMAQSTGTTEVEEVTITATNGPKNVDGVITAETEPKSRAAITQEFIGKQQSGQSVLQTINLTPGVNFTNNDPYGSAGGNLRIRGFDGNRISLTFDGVPLNDTGNYAIFSNQQEDPELIEKATVNLGSTDVDSPTASATGGTVNYTTLRPSKDPGFMADVSGGSFNYRRGFALINTGALGPYDTAAWISGSYQKYDKFRGVGTLEKIQFNAKVYQSLGDNGDFISVGFHYNQNRNNSFRSYSDAAFKFYGTNYDYLSTCNLPSALAVNGTVQNDNANAAANPAFLAAGDNPASPSSCTNFQGVRLNPSNTGNIRGQGRFTILPNLHLTVDPSFQYVLANGGGSTTISETAAVIKGVNSAGPGRDLDGDGDTLDTVRFYAPSNTNTRRYGLTSSLIWDVNDNNRLRLAYTLDYGRHRQTGEYTPLDHAGNPSDPFGGKDGHGPKVFNNDGYFLRSRDRLSFAILNQIALEYRGKFMDDALTVNIGIRAPFFKRDMNQYCYTNNTSNNVLAPSGSAVTCTSQTVASTSATNGTVTLNGSGASTFIKPFSTSVEYNKILPNIGVSYKLGDGHSVYASFSEGLSAPRTDQLYTARIVNKGTLVTPIFVTEAADVQPEETKAYDVGYRYSSGNVIASAALWYNDYKNRIVTSFDPDTGVATDRNVGAVVLYGVDAQIGWQVVDNFSLYASSSYTHSELQDNLLAGTVTVAGANPVFPTVGTQIFIPTKGKKLVETPTWTFAARGEWDITSWAHFSLQGKYVGKRAATDVNDEYAGAYTVWDTDLRIDLPWVDEAISGKGSYLQFNVTNLFEEGYYGSISSGTALNPVAGVIGTSVPAGSGMVFTNSSFYQIGAPRTFQVTLTAKF